MRHLIVCGLVVAGLAGVAVPPAAAAQPAAADTIRTNLWLAESLMEGIAREVAAALPAGQARVQLLGPADDEGAELFRAAVFSALTAAGHEVYLPNAAAEPAVPATHVLDFRVAELGLAYPEVGRTLGIWRSWIGREMTASVYIHLAEADSGRLLLDDRIDRRFGDRFPDEALARIESRAYAFTTADIAGSGLHDRLEEIVVLGTLAGLVAVYFANTSD